MSMRRATVAVLGAAALLSGCNIVGPNAISSGRATYNEVINRTEDEQILNMIVRDRYDETFGLLSVASVTANIKIGAAAGTDIGVGSSQNYAGNLVPLSAGVAYEENPTISYVPLGGAKFMRQMLAPLTFDEAMLISQATEQKGEIFSVIIARINGLGNPLAGRGTSVKFNRLADLWVELRNNFVLNVGRVAGPESQYYALISDYDGLEDIVQEFVNLLGLSLTVSGEEIVLPIRMSVGRSNQQKIEIETRSVLDIIRDVGAGVDVPVDHLDAGIVESWEATTIERDRYVKIRSSRDAPKTASVSIPFRDYWFYIDATDIRSKERFMMLRTLIRMRLDEDGLGAQAPVLTIPVGN